MAKEIPPPFGLPPGWKAMEHRYLTGKYEGQTYTRFIGPRGEKHICSVLKAVEKEAQATGQNPAKKMKEYQEAVKKYRDEKKEETKKQNEAKGILEGEKREAAVAAFRAKYGTLDGATVLQMPGWKGEAKFLENCGQTSMAYYDPDGKRYTLIKDIECFYGNQILSSNADFPEIQRAFKKSTVYVDGNRKVNPVRAKFTEEVLGIETTRKRPKLDRAMTDDDYQLSTALRVVTSEVSSADLKKAGAVNVAGKRFDTAQVRKALQKRGFSGDVELALVFATETGNAIADQLSGIYYKLASDYNDAPCYKYVALQSQGDLYCRPLFLFRSAHRKGWKIGPFDDARAGMAHTANTNDFAELPKSPDVPQKWMLLSIIQP